jgi:hypothetical protein
MGIHSESTYAESDGLFERHPLLELLPDAFIDSGVLGLARPYGKQTVNKGGRREREREEGSVEGERERGCTDRDAGPELPQAHHDATNRLIVVKTVSTVEVRDARESCVYERSEAREKAGKRRQARKGRQDEAGKREYRQLNRQAIKEAGNHGGRQESS